MWNLRTYKIYNFEKIGKISIDYSINGTLISSPHIQMTLQVQENINET